MNELKKERCQKKNFKENLRKTCCYCYISGSRKNKLLKVRGSNIERFIIEKYKPKYLTLVCVKCVIRFYDEAKKTNYHSETNEGVLAPLNISDFETPDDYAKYAMIGANSSNSHAQVK